MQRMLAVMGGLGCGLLSACGALPPTGIQAAQQTAQEFNVDSRFGRAELSLARVSPEARDEYALHHRAWGGALHVADVEMAGIKGHGDADVDVFVKIQWYRVEEEELHTTTLKQGWHSKADGWMLVSEQRLDGDVGLLGDAVVVATPATPRPTPQFPTIQLSGGSSSND
jgi:hypothetical protein